MDLREELVNGFLAFDFYAKKSLIPLFERDKASNKMNLSIII